MSKRLKANRLSHLAHGETFPSDRPTPKRILRGAGAQDDSRLRKNWATKCDNCQQVPTVGSSGLCGPCFFGEADTANGEW